MSGSPRVWNSGISWGIGRRATAIGAALRGHTFTRNRPTPAMVCEVSSSCSASNRSRWICGRIPKIMSRSVVLSSGATSSIGRSAPCSRTVGGMLAVRWRSEAPMLTA